MSGCTPNISGVPRPVLPMTPVAWHSSTSRYVFGNFSVSRFSLSSRATSPSMLNTPSVTMSLICAFAPSATPAASAAATASASFFSRST